jgi:hypothetical protein
MLFITAKIRKKRAIQLFSHKNNTCGEKKVTCHEKNSVLRKKIPCIRKKYGLPRNGTPPAMTQWQAAMKQ